MDKEKQAVLIIDEAKSDNQRFVNTPEEKAFVRKLNWKVLPLIFFIIMIQVKIMTTKIYMLKFFFFSFVINQH